MNKSIRKYLILLSFPIALLAACSKTSPEDMVKELTEEKEEQDKQQKEERVDVYLAGSFFDGNRLTAQGVNRPVYWKNGKVFMVENSSYSSGVASMFVSGDDIYLVGNESSGSLIGVSDWRASIAVYWKNGIKMSLGGASYNGSGATSIFVKGDDVYIAGWTSGSSSSREIPVYWKNGMINYLPNDTFDGNMRAYSIMVVGNDVYVLGRGATTYANDNAKYWRNGVATNLVKDKKSEFQGIYAYSMYVRNNDVYIAGVDGYRPIYWENGVGTYLETEKIPKEGRFIYVSEKGDVYVAGGTEYWKNGVPIDVELAEDEMIQSFWVSGDDVYVVGRRQRYEELGYWKNDVFTKLSLQPFFQTKDFSCNSIFVVEK